MGKEKKEKKVKQSAGSDNEEETRVLDIAPIAHPLAEKKLNKKLLKTVKKASKAKKVRRGVKDVVKGVRKGEKGFVIIAGDISPIDVITHLPVLCEDQQVPYVFIPSKEDLGTAASTKRPTSCIMVVAGKKNDKDFEDYKELYEECFKEAQQLDEKLVY
ncbi:hypothetical protein INT44_007371 [Umbelopsis vinacea]|uniref:H/ACA ribonucleoprotein complex subunit 2 n=2 Tax=Umbelopsis TaxID=64561 RepID=A0A8H7UCP3_9FUNG|nr:uncharacterized protein K450DRAFT_243429 [Umbelopsis ramanniana AG]KAG2176707.1 hypothetical protein INT44_007371 [Umbelopsis vinacea]KAI8579236.1 hypothetical protein K450DRAFT_243429 [Umbelopsis ramanniana AG]KAI9286476.1 50S ribosomal protein L30e-like protein [Umbelopsis sp. AD052]